MKLEMIGFKKLADILDTAKFKARLHRQIGKATALNAVIAESAITQAIHSGNFPGNKPNSPLTVAMKGSSRPLVDSGVLGGSVTSDTKWNEATIGVLRARPGRGGDVNIAAVLYYGAHMVVTEKMRRYFFALASKNPKIKPLSPKTRVIVIPPRKYMDVAISSDKIVEYQNNWIEATYRALRNVK